MWFAALTLSLVPPAHPRADLPTASGAGQAVFARDLARATASAPGNVACSPWSVGRLLALLEHGARGETARELHAALRTLAPAALDEYETLAKALVPPARAGTRDGTPAYTLELAAALWTARGAELVPEFVSRARSAFDAHCETLDFASPAARTTIHEWIAKATSGRITELLPAGSPPSDTRLVLVDTIHLVAAWVEAFAVSATKPATFTRVDGTGVEVPFLHRTDSIAIGESSLARVAALPYEGGLELVLALPKKADGLDTLLAREDAAEWSKGLKTQRVELQLPKFAFESQLELGASLRALGIVRAFDRERAEFAGVTAKEPVYLDLVVQRVVLALDEQGTEASAATALVMRAGAARPDGEPIPLHFDRPFAFALRQRASGCVLFAGVVRDPSLRNF